MEQAVAAGYQPICVSHNVCIKTIGKVNQHRMGQILPTVLKTTINSRTARFMSLCFDFLLLCCFCKQWFTNIYLDFASRLLQFIDFNELVLHEFVKPFFFFFHRITGELILEGTSRDHLVQPPAQAGPHRTHCTRWHPGELRLCP